MNIFLVPYTWLRHLQTAFWCGIFSLLAWWVYISWFLLLGPFWSPSMDGYVWCNTLVVFTAMGAVLCEGSLRRSPLRWRLLKLATAGGVGFLSNFILFFLYKGFLGSLVFSLLNIIKPLVGGDVVDIELGDPHRIIFQHQLTLFVLSGLSVSIGTLFARKWDGWVHVANHLLGGVFSGLALAATWAYFLYFAPSYGSHLYFSAAIGSLMFGLVFGLSAWTIPDSLYAGWIRVLSPTRFGYRVPIDAKPGMAKERFIGSYTNGLDIYLPPQEGVMELHISAYVDEKQRYYVRGLSQKETILSRFLEKIRMNYDPASPAPFETELSSEDRVQLGEQAEVEFIMLPREEK